MIESGPALLLVDDNDDNRYTLGRRLNRVGYTNLTTALNGREALDLLRARRFDLVLLDVMMPEMNGYEVLKELKADARLRHVPVIMISALDQIESIIHCIELGAEDYLPKPFNPTLLKARVGASLEKKRLRDEIDAYLARIEEELAWARQIQLDMVPRDFPSPTPANPLDIFAVLQPARQVGGDLYDFFYRDANTLCLVIADVSDKGAPAALFMARTKTLVRLVATLLRADSDVPPAPAEVVAMVNRELCADNRQSMFVTLVLAMIDLPSHRLHYCNAGHVQPIISTSTGELQVLGDGRGLPLGIMPSAAYETAEHRLVPGDCLFLYTDGVTEAEDGNGGFFEDSRLQDALRDRVGVGARVLVEGVIERVRAFSGGAAQSDDIAAIAVRLGSEAPTAGKRGESTLPEALPARSEIVIRNRTEDVPQVLRRLDELGTTHRLPADAIADMQVALDEVLTNIIQYAYPDPGPHDIHVAFCVHHDSVEAVVQDAGQPFDPLSVAPVDRFVPLRERPVGGLGIHLVRSLMSEVIYAREGDANRLTLKRNLSDRKG
jgi:sigma-B regulation protein RsbU (phosphoserine phosphatase)